MKKHKVELPSISGVPEEVQKIIVEDVKKVIAEEKPAVCKFKIGISISDNEDLGKLGFANIHLKDLTVEIVRNLLINEFSLIYGGDLRKEGYTEIFSDLAYQYRSVSESKAICFENFFAFPIYLQLTKAHTLEFKKHRTVITKVSPPADLDVNEDLFLRPDTLQGKFIWARSLTKMRNEMIKASDGRILVGGKVNNYLGIIPGVIEEAQIALQQNKPLYLIGAFGGSAKYVADAIMGTGFGFVTDAFHKSKSYLEFRDFYNEKHQKEIIDLIEISKFFQGYGIDNLAANNGLSKDENLRLFTTPHQSEIIYLIFKGMNNLA